MDINPPSTSFQELVHIIVKINKMRRVNIIILLVLIARLGLAQANTINYELSGFMEFDNISYFDNFDSKINGRNQTIFQLKFEAPLHKQIFFLSSVELREDLNDEKRRRIILDECYFKLPFKHLNLQIGKQIISWGKTDGINPTNNFNPVDYSDLMDTDDETIGLLAFNAKLFLKDWSIQALVSPMFQSDVLPVSIDSRWNVDVFNLLANDNQIPNYIPVYLPENSPENDIRATQFGFNISNSIKGFDFEINYYNGYNHIPAANKLEILPINANMDTFQISLQQSYHKMQVVGFGFATSLGKLGLRGEGAYFMPEDILIDNPYFQYVVGVDKNISNIIGSNNLLVLLQWIHEITEDNISYSYYDFNHLFQKSLMARLEFELGFTSKIILQGIYNVDNEDCYIRSGLEMNVFDGINFTIYYDMFEGKSTSFFGLFNNNDRIQFKLKYSF